MNSFLTAAWSRVASSGSGNNPDYGVHVQSALVSGQADTPPKCYTYVHKQVHQVEQRAIILVRAPAGNLRVREQPEYV